MKTLWCWRCKSEMPMLDEAEYAEVSRLYGEGMNATKEYRQRFGLTLGEFNRYERFRPLREAYERMTGYKEANQFASMSMLGVVSNPYASRSPPENRANP